METVDGVDTDREEVGSRNGNGREMEERIRREREK